MTSDQKRDDDMLEHNAEWAWVADAYRDVPGARPEAIARALNAAVAASPERGRSIPWRWVVGAAAVIAAVVLGRALTRSQPGAPVASSEAASPGRGAAVPADSAVAPDDVPRVVPRSEPQPAPTTLARETPAPPAPSATPPSPVAPAESSLAVVPQQSDMAKASGAPAPSQQAPVPAAPVKIAGVNDADLARLRAGLGETGLRSLAAVLTTAVEEGMPSAPLVDRAMAGLAHAAPSSVILAAVDRRAAALRQARGVLGGVADNELTAGADALEAGATASQLATVQRLFPRGRATAGLLALAGLVTDGVPAPAAAEALAQSVDAGASDATLLALRTGVTADIARGVAPLAALRAQVERLGHEAPERPAPPRDPTPRSSPIDLPRAP